MISTSILTNNTQSKRPNFIVKRHHENRRIRYRPKTLPGNSSYKDVVNFGKKNFILGTSMVKRRRMKEYNQ